jgi:transposase
MFRTRLRDARACVACARTVRSAGVPAAGHRCHSRTLARSLDGGRDGVSAKTDLAKIISAAVPTALTELITLGRTLKRRAADVLAYLDQAGTSNGPTEAINGRLEHLRG